jgi:hypothetical protein
MITTRIDISIACPAAQVVARLSDFEKNPTWQNGMKSCTWITDPPLRIGSRYDQKAQFSGCDINSVFGVDRVRAGPEGQGHYRSRDVPDHVHPLGGAGRRLNHSGARDHRG